MRRVRESQESSGKRGTYEITQIFYIQLRTPHIHV